MRSYGLVENGSVNFYNSGQRGKRKFSAAPSEGENGSECDGWEKNLVVQVTNILNKGWL